MEDYFVGYLLDALDEPTRRQVDAYLEDCPEARERLALLKQALEPLEADFAPAAPPPQLVERTLAKVAETICAPVPVLDDLPQAPPVSPTSVGGAAAWWHRADMLVAVTVIVTIVGVGLTILAKMRAPSSAAIVVECRNNLRHFFTALHTYRDQQGKFPDITKEAESRRVAGMAVPILMDAGVLPSDASIRCPGIGDPVASPFTLTELRSLSTDEFNKRAPSLSMCYAYSLGYRSRSGSLHIASDVPADSWSQLPIMADRPPAEGILLNSINHGASAENSGQNVLFADGHVRFLRQRNYAPGDDIFLNRDNQVAAGVDLSDIVLGYSSARP